MMMKNFFLAGIALLVIFGLAMTGCDVGVNPLLFDGTPVSGNFRIDANSNSYSDSTTIALGDVMSKIDKQIDSIKVFNITMLIDSATGTPTISGTGTIDGHTLLTLTNASISLFSSERSIFDPTLTAAGVTYGVDGVSYINNLLKNPNSLPSTVTVTVSGTSSANLHCTIKLKLYTQVFTAPPNN